MDSRERRVGENEALFRHVNEQIDELDETFGHPERQRYLCECGDRSCQERIELTPAEYRHVRERGDTFAVAGGHDDPAVEHVVERHEGWVVVKKEEGGPAELARSGAR